MHMLASNRNNEGKFIPKNITLNIKNLFFRNISSVFGVGKRSTSGDLNKNTYILYRELNNRIKRGVINYQTQLGIEEYLFEYDIGNLNEKFSNIYEF